MKLYLIGALKNERIPIIANEIRDLGGFDVVDDWFSPGPEADEMWQRHEKIRGRTYKEALEGLHAEHVFNFDYKHLSEADVVVMLLPCGKSGHLELGWAAGWTDAMKSMGAKRGIKHTYVLFEQEPDRYDIMYRFADDVFLSKEELYKRLQTLLGVDDCGEGTCLTDIAPQIYTGIER